MAPVRACVFDVDGLLINSEDIYTKVMNSVLHSHGIQQDLPWSVKARQQSRGRDGMVHVLKWAGLDVLVDDFITECRAKQEIFRESRLLPGVEELLQRLARCDNVKLAIASSAGRQMFHVKTDHLPTIAKCVPFENCAFGNDPEMEGKSVKPAPDIFLLALKHINQNLTNEGQVEIEPSECLVFEDSTAGVEAGLRAGMQVVWIPHPGLSNVYKGKENLVLSGKADLLYEQTSDSTPANAAQKNTAPTKNEPSWTGRATMLSSLEDFPFEEYGIRIS